MTPSRFKFLMDRYRLHSLSPDEEKELLAFASKGDERLWLDLLDPLMTEESGAEMQLDQTFISQELHAVLSADKHIQRKTVRGISFLRIWWAAAAVIFLLSAGAYFWKTNKQEPVTAVADIKPGREGAVLTLADGTQVSLDSIQNKVVALQGGVQVKILNGRLVYEGKGSEIVYNTMHTPRGRQFQMTLPDGTKVWLNAASSIRYPVVFTGNERRVEVKGEAYFEVAANAKMPFRVSVNSKIQIDVLGTHFNVNAYTNEPSVNTTLLEGSLRTGGLVLQPGQQAQQKEASAVKLVKNADINQVMAWKNGMFSFENATLEEVMRQLERWYDIEVVYENGIPAATFFGKISRKNSLQAVLDILEKSNVHFRLEGRTLRVRP